MWKVQGSSFYSNESFALSELIAEREASVTYRVSNVLGSVISCCFLHLIGRADGLLVGADYSGKEGQGEGGVVSLAGRGSGKRDQS